MCTDHTPHCSGTLCGMEGLPQALFSMYNIKKKKIFHHTIHQSESLLYVCQSAGAASRNSSAALDVTGA